MYISNGNQNIVQDPRRTHVPGIIEFINNTCVFSPGSTMPTEEVYDRYVRYCKDHGFAFSDFRNFAKSFKYYAFHNNMVPGLGYEQINYYHDKPGFGIVRKHGWGYRNLAVNY